MSQPIVRVEKLTKRFPVSKGVFERAKHFVHAVDEISFDIGRGEIFGLVGESGCGKTTTARLMVRLEDPTGGHIHFYGGDRDGSVDIASLRGRALKTFRRRAQMIFQDPYESMNPRKTIFDTVGEPLLVQGIGNAWQREERVA